MHGIGREDVPLDQALLPDSFLAVLRPYSGLREENFLQVLGAIIALAPHLKGRQLWERRLVEGLWELTMRARQWGLDPRSMLQRNRLLSAAETARLMLWVHCIEMAISRLFRGNDPSQALTHYRECTTGGVG
jgi:hypothetical protein